MSFLQPNKLSVIILTNFDGLSIMVSGGNIVMQSIIKLGRDDRPPACAICIYSRAMTGLDELMCAKKGIVSPDYLCKKFSLDITAKTARRKRALDGPAAPEDFVI